MRRAQIALAEQGRDLLEEKRDQLLEEYRRAAGEALAGADALERAAAEARLALARAEALDGPEEVRSAALTTASEISLNTRAVTVMGVRLADIDHPPLGRSCTARGYTLAGSSPHIDRAAERCEAELELLLEHAAAEMRLRRLAAEIGRATRRVNALDIVVIPRLVAERNLIQAVLDERERQDRFRLKRIKARKGTRMEVGG